jgi:hypothetical protein
MLQRWGGVELEASGQSAVSSGPELGRPGLVGEALAALLEADGPKGGLARRATETFGAAALPLPGVLRQAVWEAEYTGARREESWRRWEAGAAARRAEQQGGAGAGLVRAWVARQHAESRLLPAWAEEGRAGEEQLLAMRLLTLACRGESDLALLYWLQPLLPALQADDLESEEALLELGWRLDRLAAHGRLPDAKLHQLVDGVFRDLGRRDPRLHFQLLKLARGAERCGQPEDLLPAVLSPQGPEGARLRRELVRAGGRLQGDKLKKVFTDGGKVFVRKWISEVSYVSTQAMPRVRVLSACCAGLAWPTCGTCCSCTAGAPASSTPPP